MKWISSIFGVLVFFLLSAAICTAGPVGVNGNVNQNVKINVPHLPQKPDLYIGDINLSPSTPEVGKKFDVIVTVGNHARTIPISTSGVPGGVNKYGAHRPFGGGGKSLNLGKGSAPTTLELRVGSELKTIPVPALDPDAKIFVRKSFTAATPGNLQVSCVVDPRNLVDEFNENNNRKNRVFHVAAPDYKVVDFYARPASPRALDQMTIYAVVKNDGDAGGKTFMRFSIHGDIPGSNDVVTHSDVPVPYLAPGKQTTVSYRFTPAKPGTYTFGGGVNTPARDPESNTHNNVVPRVLRIQVKPAGVDLAIIRISTPHTHRHWGQNFDVSVTVKNIGNMASGPFRVHFYRFHDYPAGSAQGTLIDSFQGCTSLAPNGTCTVRFRFNYKVFLGSFTAKVKVDPERAVKDINRTNNSGTISLRVF